MEESHLGAEAICQTCFEPFGQSEASKVPYAIGCGHTICLGCLDTAESCCTICGTYFDRQVYSELLDLRKYDSKVPFTSSQLARQFQEAIARLNDFTDISQIRRLYSRVHSFLECQPRNRFTDLETNVRLIGCLLQSKEAVIAHNHLIAELSGKINALRSDNFELRARVEELERQQKYDHADITRRLPDILRRNPDFDLLSDEVLEFRKEINELKDMIHDFRSLYPHLMQSIESLPSPSYDIQYHDPVHPAYRSDFGSPSLVKSGLDLDSLDLLGNLAELHHPISITRTEALTPDLSAASDSSESIESLSGAESTGCDDEPQKSYFEDDDYNDSEVCLLSEVQHEASSKDVTEGSQALSQTGYAPSEAGTTIRQPRAIYPVNTVRFNLDVVNNFSRPRSEAEFNSTPASEADSVMAMSISSLPMLKTPLTQTVKLNDKITNQIPTTLLGDQGCTGQ